MNVLLLFNIISDLRLEEPCYVYMHALYISLYYLSYIKYLRSFVKLNHSHKKEYWHQRLY